MVERTRPVEQMLDLTEETPSVEHLDNQVQKAQEQLLQLKRQQEQIEKQKRELEELSRVRTSWNMAARNDRQVDASAGRARTRSVQRAKPAGANSRSPRKFAQHSVSAEEIDPGTGIHRICTRN